MPEVNSVSDFEIRGTSNSYLYNTSAGTVRLTWKWKAASGLRTGMDGVIK